MKKKFTMLLASLFLTIGTAWALPTEGQLYRIKNVVTGYYLDITSTQVGGIQNKALDVLDVNQCFYFIPSETDGKHYIKSANNQYVARSGSSLWDMCATNVVPSGNSGNGHITLVSVADTEDQYYLQTTSTASWGNNMAPNDGQSQEGASIYADKAQGANYPKWQVIAVTEAELTALIANAKDVTLAAAVTEANTWLEKDKVASSDAGTALSSAVSAAQNLSATAKIEEITAAITAIQTATVAADKYYNTISTLTDLVDNEFYKLYGHRGFIYAADGVIKGTNVVSATYDANNMNQHFAILKKDDKYYLYNVGAKKFVIKSGNNTTLVELPEQPITLESINNSDYPWAIKLNGTNKINLSSGWNSYGVYTEYNGDDEGNRWNIYRVGTFDNSEALAAFNKVYVTVNYVLGSKKTVTKKEAITKGETYNITNPYVYTSIASCTKGDETLTANNGTYSFEVTEATTVTVNLEEQLPFTLSEDYENAVWYRLKIRPNNDNGNTPKWVVRKAEKPYDNVTTAPTDNNGLWAFVGNAIDGVQVLNKEAGANQTLGFDNMNNQTPVYMKEGATSWTLGKLAKDGYEGFLLRQGTTGNKYLHDFGSQLKFWDASGAPTDLGSAFVAEAPLSITYLYKGEELTEYKVDTYVNYGTVHTITNPFANTKKYIAIGECAATGSQPVNTNGAWTVKVTEATSITVTIVDDLPFKVSESYANATWYYMNIRSDDKKYVAMSDAAEYSNTKTSPDEKGLWAFMGDANGIQIINKAAGEGKALSFEGDAAGDKAVVMREEEKAWTIERAATGFLLRAGSTGNLYVHDLGGKLKIWNSTSAPGDLGSAFNVVEEKGVKSLEELALNPQNLDIYTIQAERSPLMYSATETTKLSSGLLDGVAASETDINQQFLILRTASTPEGYFYLYSLAAEKFVDETLKFIDYPAPVLSLEASNHTVYPWRVKVDNKYVIPGTGGTDGNKLHHTTEGDDDEGKRFRIIKVGESYDHYTLLSKIEEAEDMIKLPSELSLDKVYTVSTFDEGYWYYNSEKDALWSTEKAGVEPNSQDINQQFAFLTVAGHTYLYSMGAQKFVIKKEGNTEYSDVPSQAIELLDAEGSRFYPFVAAFVNGEERHHIGISNGYETPVITFYNDLNDNGNKIKLREVTPGYMPENAAELLEEALGKIEAYLAAEELKPELESVIAQAEALLAKNYLDTEDAASLTNAKNTAQAVYDEPTSGSEALTEQINLLTAAINAVTYVTEVADFKNCYVYTFLSNRNETAYMMYDGEHDFVASKFKQTGLEVGSDNENCQWAVYKTENNHYYMYNLGAQKFMGTETAANTGIPFSATPQTTDLKLKKSRVATHPIMISSNGGQGTVNHSNNADFTNNYGVVNWANNFGHTDDAGNVHKVAIVGALTEATLKSIADAVELYETQGVAIQALEVAIAAAQAKVGGMGEGLGYYSSTDADAATTLATIVEFKNTITAETTVAAIEVQTAAANALVETFSVNLPEAGKFYRFSYKYGENDVKYVQAVASNAPDKENAMVMTADQGAASIFYYDGGADAESVEDDRLLSYSAGQYVNETGNTRGLQAVGNTGGKAKFEAGSKAGKLYIFAGDSFHANKSGDVCFIDHCGAGHPDKGDGDEHNFTVEEVATLPVAVSAVGYATFIAPVALKIPDGVKAYTGNINDKWLTLAEIEGGVIPANTGVVLEAAKATYNFNIVADVEAIASDLVGSTAAKVNDKKAEEQIPYYTLQKRGDEVVFMQYNGDVLAGSKAYLDFTANPTAAQSIGIRFGEGTSSIGNAQLIIDNETTVIYDLLGRRVEKMEKGIYIVNGKKVVIK